MQINASRLPFLLEIARNGGVLAAADAMKLTPSAVSQQLNRLEREVGESLVDRSPSGMSLTVAGRELVELAENIEREINETAQRITAGTENPTGQVRLGTFQSFITSVLAPALPRWRKELFGVQLEIVEATRSDLLRALRAADLDLIVIEYDAAEPAPPLSPSTREIPLLDDPWKLVAPSGTFAAMDVVELERLRTPWLGVEATAATLQAVRRIRTPLGTSPSRHVYADYQTAMSLVAAGEGMTLLSQLTLHGQVLEGVDIADVPGLGARRLALRHRTGRRGPSEAVSAATNFIRDISAAFQAEPAGDSPG